MRNNAPGCTELRAQSPPDDEEVLPAGTQLSLSGAPLDIRALQRLIPKSVAYPSQLLQPPLMRSAKQVITRRMIGREELLRQCPLVLRLASVPMNRSGGLPALRPVGTTAGGLEAPRYVMQVSCEIQQLAGAEDPPPSTELHPLALFKYLDLNLSCHSGHF